MVWLHYCAQRDGIRRSLKDTQEWGHQDHDPNGSWPFDPSVDLKTYSFTRQPTISLQRISYPKLVNVTHINVVVHSDSTFDNLSSSYLHWKPLASLNCQDTPFVNFCGAIHCNLFSDSSWPEIHIPSKGPLVTRERTISPAIISLQLCHDATKIRGRQRRRRVLTISNTRPNISSRPTARHMGR